MTQAGYRERDWKRYAQTLEKELGKAQLKYDQLLEQHNTLLTRHTTREHKRKEAERTAFYADLRKDIGRVLLAPFRLVWVFLKMLVAPFGRLKRFWRSPEGPMGTLLGFLVLVLVGVVLLPVGMVIYHEFYDIREGTVTDKEHHGEWTQFVQSGKTLTPIHHPETWSLTIERDGETASWTVSEDRYDRTSIGDYACFEDVQADCEGAP